MDEWSSACNISVRTVNRYYTYQGRPFGVHMLTLETTKQRKTRCGLAFCANNCILSTCFGPNQDLAALIAAHEIGLQKCAHRKLPTHGNRSRLAFRKGRPVLVDEKEVEEQGWTGEGGRSAALGAAEEVMTCRPWRCLFLRFTIHQQPP